MIESLLIAIVTSTTVTGILVLFVNSYLKKLVEHEFNKRQRKLELAFGHEKAFSERITSAARHGEQSEGA